MTGVETTSSKNQTADAEFRVYALGFCYASVCSSLDPETTRKRLEAEHPTFGETWRLAEEQFRAERDHAHPCDQAPATHKHYLFRRQDEAASWDATHPGQTVH